MFLSVLLAQNRKGSVVLYLWSLWGSTKYICSLSVPLLWGYSKLCYRFALLSHCYSKQWGGKIFIWWSKLHIYLLAWFITHLLWWAWRKWRVGWKLKKVCEYEGWFFSWKPNVILFPLNNIQSCSKKTAHQYCVGHSVHLVKQPLPHTICAWGHTRRQLGQEVQGLEDFP